MTASPGNVERSAQVGFLDRVTCEHAHECAGCPLIDLTYEEQLERKRERVKKAALPYPALSQLGVEPVSAAEPITGYRVRAKLMVGARRDGTHAGAASLGLFARAAFGGDHHVVDIPGCQVLSPSLRDVAAKLRRLLEKPPEGVGPCLVAEASGGVLSAFDLREVVDAEAGVLVTLILAAGRPVEESELACAVQALRQLSTGIVGIAVNFREPGAVQVLGPITRSMWGSNAARDRIGSTYRLATFGSFTQVHPRQAERIEQWISSRLRRDAKRVLDLYGGSGALSLPLARAGAEVTLVESFRPAAECAERAAKEQDLGGYVVRSGEAANVLKHLCSVGTRFDLVITNPPRRGMQPAVRSAIAELEPPLIAYVSCDPDTLCRDLDHLSRLGYRVDELLPVDMIPLTDHVETVAFLTKSVRPDRVPLYEDDHIFIIERFAHDSPSYDSGKTHHHRLYDAGLVAGASGVSSGLAIGCKTSTNEPLLRAALSKSGAQFTYLALCRGIVGRSGVIQRKTRYERLARSQGHSVVGIAIAPGTGPRIERDLASIGHPIIGDARYGHSPTNRHFEEKYALDRPFLHRIRVEFDHPITGSRVVEQGTLAGELTMVLGRLGIVALDVVKQVMVG